MNLDVSNNSNFAKYTSSAAHKDQQQIEVMERMDQLEKKMSEQFKNIPIFISDIFNKHFLNFKPNHSENLSNNNLFKNVAPSFDNFIKTNLVNNNNINYPSSTNNNLVNLSNSNINLEKNNINSELNKPNIENQIDNSTLKKVNIFDWQTVNHGKKKFKVNKKKNSGSK